ncbi:MAG: CRISPR-associated helicase Cas3', partial [Acidobacteriota bacterium]
EGELLLQHSTNVARNGEKLCQNLPFAPELREELAIVLIQIGAFHDLGKAATGFQKMLRGGGNWGHRHETLSTAIARVINPNLEDCGLLAILTHHRNIPDGLTSKTGEKCLPMFELPPDFCGTEDDSQWQIMLGEMFENWDSFKDLLDKLSRELNINFEPINKDSKLLDFGLDNDWLEREPRFYKNIPKEKRWRASLLRGLLISSDHLASAIEPETRQHPKLLDIPNLNDYEKTIIAQEIGKHQILPFQEKAAQTKGNTILKAPTGSGKTLAAMIWAKNNQVENGRFFYVLPFTASINAMSNRFQQIFGEKQVGVLHHRNADYLFRMMENGELSVKIKNKQAKHLASLAREMYHPIRVCTPHQILRFALRGRGWEMGLSEFHQACFVFDEVHAFEPLLAGLTLATVKLLTSDVFNAKVLFASATIPKFLENYIREEIGISADQIISPNPENELDKIVCNKERHKITVREDSLLENLSQIADEIIEYGESALIVCNHVKTSQQVWEYFATEQFEDLT